MAVTVNVCVSPPLKDDFHCTLALVTSHSISKIIGVFGFPVIGKKKSVRLKNVLSVLFKTLLRPFSKDSVYSCVKNKLKTSGCAIFYFVIENLN